MIVYMDMLSPRRKDMYVEEKDFTSACKLGVRVCEVIRMVGVRIQSFLSRYFGERERESSRERERERKSQTEKRSQ